MTGRSKSAAWVGAGLFLALVLSAAPARAEQGGGSCDGGFDHDHATWTGVLERYVRGREVSYSGLRSGGRDELDHYLRALEGVCRDQYAGWSGRQKLAFWINVYNAYTVKLVLDHGPIDSIMEIGSKRGAAFDQRFIPFERLRGKRLSLNDVENRIIRREFREPRIHFAVNCASVSCPRLREEAYTASKLDRQLESQTRAYIRNPEMNRYDAGSNTLYLSRIFQWYEEDFTRGEGTVAGFVARYLGGEAAEAIKTRSPEVEYLEYDWSLNGR